MPKAFLILRTGAVPPDIPHQESFEDMFLRAADYGLAGAVVVDAVHGELPEDVENFAGVIITGSPAMVTEREPWSERCAVWVKKIVELGAHTLGVCYGHQLMAHAFDGIVDRHPQGTELGTHTVFLLPEEKMHPLLAGMPHLFSANMAHSQTVLTPPGNARVLARSNHDPHQILAYGERALSFQFHPEFDKAVMQAYVEAEIQEGRNKALSWGLPVLDTPLAAVLLQRFIDRATATGEAT